MVDAKIKSFLYAFPESIAPLGDLAMKHLSRPCRVERNGSICIAHQPKVAPESYAIRLYPPVSRTAIDSLGKQIHKRIPSAYVEFLSATNGCFAYSMSLCGVTPMLLDRTTLNCHSLFFANSDWIHEYKVDSGEFHFGGRSYSYSENLGYFIAADSIIRSRRTNGQIVGEWSCMKDFLADELAVSETLKFDES